MSSRKEQRKQQRLAKKKRHHEALSLHTRPKSTEAAATPVVAQQSQRPKKKKKKAHDFIQVINTKKIGREDDADEYLGNSRIEADQQEIERLESKLGLKSSGKGLSKLNKEFERDGLGGDFGDFLSGLDRITEVVKKAKREPKSKAEASKSPLRQKPKKSKLPQMDEATRREFELLQKEDAAFLKGIEDLPTDDEEEEDDDVDLSFFESDEDCDEEAKESEDEVDEKMKLKKKKSGIPAMDEATRREFELLQQEEGDFLSGMEDLPTDDEEEDDDDVDLSTFDSEDDEDESDDQDDEVRRNTILNSRSHQSQVEGEAQNDDDSDNEHDKEGNDEDDTEGSEETNVESEEEEAKDGSKGSDESDSEAEEEEEEDIYGRVKSKVEKASFSKYVPPHLRKSLTEDEQKQRNLLRAINGQLNRLSESNMESILLAFEQIYRENTRREVNKLLLERIDQLCCNDIQIMTPLITMCTGLIAGLHHSIGSEIGGFFIEHFVLKVHKMLEDVRSTHSAKQFQDDRPQSKEMQNLALVIAYMYNFQLVQSVLISDFFRALVESLTEAEVDVMLLLLQHCGHQLRSDDPAAFKQMIQLVQQRMRVDTSPCPSGRVKFLLDSILELDSSKKKKSVDGKDRFQKLKKWIGRVKTRCDSTSKSLRLSWEEVVNAEEKGRWWVVGGTWVGYQKQEHAQDKADSKRSKLLELAKKQRMNTDVRRQIFCAMMGAQDACDAFEQILKLGLKEKQEREIVRVLIDCCGQEKTSNRFYAALGAKFCDLHQRFRFTFQLAFWDCFKQLSKFKPRRLYNLGCLCAHLITKRALSLLCLKTLEFVDANVHSNQWLFLQVVFEKLLDVPEEEVEQCFQAFQHLTHVKDLMAASIVWNGLAYFFHQHFRPTIKKSIQNKDQMKRIASRLHHIQQTLDRQFIK